MRPDHGVLRDDVLNVLLSRLTASTSRTSSFSLSIPRTIPLENVKPSDDDDDAEPGYQVPSRFVRTINDIRALGVVRISFRST
jgi:hypothetical protein